MTLVSACVCCLFYIGACFVNLGMALDYSFLFFSFYNFIPRSICRFHLHMLVLMSKSHLVLFVVVVSVFSLLSLLIVYYYLLVTGTVFLKQIVCNAG